MKTGDYRSGIAAVIRAPLEEVGCKNLKTLGAQQPQECPYTNPPESTGEDVSRIASRIGVSLDEILKTM